MKPHCKCGYLTTDSPHPGSQSSPTLPRKRERDFMLSTPRTLWCAEVFPLPLAGEGWVSFANPGGGLSAYQKWSLRILIGCTCSELFTFALHKFVIFFTASNRFSTSSISKSASAVAENFCTVTEATTLPINSARRILSSETSSLLAK